MYNTHRAQSYQQGTESLIKRFNAYHVFLCQIVKYKYAKRYGDGYQFWFDIGEFYKASTEENMKYSIAIALVIATMSSAEPPPRSILARQQQPPYQPRGIRPVRPAFNVPLRSQKQQLPPTPAASYGPPPQEYGPPTEVTTTETPTTTETIETTTTAPQAETIREAQKLQEALYVVVPQTQDLIYATAPVSSAKLVQQPRLVPVQAIPAFARIQEIPQVARIVQYPVASSGYTSIVNTPYSSTFVQSFQ
ncbi:uncharacterized protein [Euwallacea similis]|uniref:uncharacterized protein isoform X2 n=1 Tax=Euwallacea similis TaxID=1736056 RepID=UPI00344EF91F